MCVLFLDAVGVRENSYMAVENMMDVLCLVRSPRASCSSRAMNPPLCRLVALDLAQSSQSYVHGAALGGEPSNLHRT